MAAPWMTLASSLQRNRMTRAISAGFGHLEKSAAGMALRLASVSIMLGRMEFTRMPLPFRSAASESSMATAADFAAAYAAAPAAWSNAAFAATFTMAPWPFVDMARTAARDSAYPERRFRASI